MNLDVPVAGVQLGFDRLGTEIVVPMVRRKPVRLGLLGPPTPARLLAYRLVSAGASVTVVSHRQPTWKPLRARVQNARLAIVDNPPPWPARPSTQPGGNPGPQAFFADLPSLPPLWLGDMPWTTVLHIADHVPAQSDFWHNAEAVIVNAPGHGRALADLFGRPDVSWVDSLPPGYLALVDRWRVALFRLALTPAENDLMA